MMEKIEPSPRADVPEAKRGADAPRGRSPVKDLVMRALTLMQAHGINPVTVDPEDARLADYAITPAAARMVRKLAKTKARRRLGGRP